MLNELNIHTVMNVAQLGKHNVTAGAVGAFSGEVFTSYIIDSYNGGRNDNMSEQEHQQIGTLVTIASGSVAGLQAIIRRQPVRARRWARMWLRILAQ
ncbi:hypothetical protein GFZ86_23445 [Escherichia coli]|nr:hypothetical protein [Escherichia coli]EFH9139919.1 hypothetical protein [Escherichia coli]SQR13428.1 Uncharacterised protein [Escherichia coli]SQR92411.1 Uncharacterised protein [Escherichia coli]SQS45748.1 Uncharacterised protein [Escherichia coli]